MKVLLVTAFIVSTSWAATVKQERVMVEGPKCPFAAVEPIPDGSLAVTIGTLEKPGSILLHISEQSRQEGGKATGLQNIHYKVDINLLSMKATFEAQLPGTICAKGDSYVADGLVDATPFTDLVCPTGPFKGKGAYDACITDTAIAGMIQIKLNLGTGKISIKTLELSTIQFAHANINLGEMTVNDKLVDWSKWSRDLKTNFDKEWPTYGAAFLDRCKEIANAKLSEYTLDDLLELIPGVGVPQPC